MSTPAGARGRWSPRARLASPVLRNIGWLASERIFQTVIGGTVGIVVARYLGPSRFGTYAFAGSIVLLVSSCAQINSALIVRDLVTAPEREPITLGSAAALSAILAVVAELVVAGIYFFLIPDTSQTTRALIAVFATSMLFNPLLVADIGFQARLGARRSTLARNCGATAAALAEVAVVLTNSGIVALAAATLLFPAVTALMYFATYSKVGSPVVEWRPSLAVARSVFRRGAPLSISSIAVLVYMRIDQVMLGWLSNRTQTGIYAATVPLSELIYFVPTIVVISVQPGLLALRESSHEEYRKRLSAVFTFLAGAAFVAIVAVEIAGAKAAVLLFGNAYQGIGPVLKIHILAALFVFFGMGDSIWIISESLQVYTLVKTVVAAVVNILLNLILLPRYGAVGAAWATLIAYAVASTVGDVAYAPTRPLFRMQMRSLDPRNTLKLVREEVTRLRP